MITYRASNRQCWNSLQSHSPLHHILNVVVSMVVVVVVWSFNRINTVQMLRQCAAAVKLRAPVRQDSRISLWERLLHLPPL